MMQSLNSSHYANVEDIDDIDIPNGVVPATVERKDIKDMKELAPTDEGVRK